MSLPLAGEIHCPRCLTAANLMWEALPLGDTAIRCTSCGHEFTVGRYAGVRLPALVWRPLDVGGLRLYRVTVLWTCSSEDRFVLATSPNEAKRAIEREYAEYARQPTIVAGSELTVLQPAEGG